MAYRRGNPGVWGTAGPLPRTPVAPKPAPRIPGAIAAPTDPYAGAMSSVEQIIQAMLGDVQRQQDQARAQAEMEANRKLAEGQALAYGLQQLGISGAVQSAFQNAANAQSGLAQGFSGATRDSANAYAADQARQLSGTGQEGAVRNQGEAMGNVTYSQGYIPATANNAMGAAFGAQAALQPGFALQFGQIAKAEREREWADELMKFADMKADVLAKKPDLFKEFAGDPSKPQELDARTLADGRIQYFDPFTGRAVGKPQGPKRAERKTSAGKNSVRTLANGQLQAFNAQGKPVGKPYGPARAEKTSNLQARSLANGQLQWFDPQTGQPVGRPQGPVRKTAKKTSSGQSYNLQLKKLADGRQQWFDPRTGKAVGAPIGPPKAPKPQGRPDGMTPTQVRSARANAFQIVNGWSANGRKDDEGNDYLPKDLLKYMIQEEGIPFDVAVRVLAKKVPAARKWYKNQPSSGVKPEKGAVPTPASFQSTHMTDGLGWPAVDIMGNPGQPVASPASGTIVRHGSAQGGEALYLRANDGTMYWLGHIDDMLPVGARVRKGQTIARISANHPRPHVHLAKQSGTRA